MKPVIAAVLVIVLVGCVRSPCERDQAYHHVEPRPPLEVPEGLSKPRARSAAPEVASGNVARRPDGRCLEQPPVFVPKQAADATAN